MARRIESTPRSWPLRVAGVLAAAGLCTAANAWVPLRAIGLDERRLDKIQQERAADPDRVRLHADRGDLALLRVQGVDASLALRTDTMRASVAVPLAASTLDESIARRLGRMRAPGPLESDGPLRFRLDRNTELTDGGIGTPGGPIGAGEGVASVTTGEGEYTLTDLEMQWSAAKSGPLEVRIVSGVTTIQADVSARFDGGMHEVHSRVVPVPTVGSALRWEISDGWSISSQALTQSIDLGSSLMDFSARSDWRLGDRVGISAGYQIIRSSFEVDSVSSDFDREGLFARLRIEF